MATPKPVPMLRHKPGATTITWSTGDGSFGQVYVSAPGEPEKMVSQGNGGTFQVPWIYPHPYGFRVYAGKEHKQRLATITVYGVKK